MKIINSIKKYSLIVWRSQALKYAVVCVVGVLIVGFLDENSLWNHLKNRQRIEELAEEKARTMVQSQEVYRVAQQQSAEMISSAQAKSEQLRLAASKYAQEILKNTASAVQNTADQLKKQCDEFQAKFGEEPARKEPAPAEEKPVYEDLPVE